MSLLPKSFIRKSLITASMRVELVAAYTAPDRHYHDLRHIEALLDRAYAAPKTIHDRAAVFAAEMN